MAARRGFAALNDFPHIRGVTVRVVFLTFPQSGADAFRGSGRDACGPVLMPGLAQSVRVAVLSLADEYRRIPPGSRE